MPPSESTRRLRHPMGHLPWWKMLGGTVALCGLLGALVAFFPFREYAAGDVGIVVRAYGTPPGAVILSPASVVLGILVAFVATAVIMWNWKAYSWLSRVSSVAVFTTIFLVIGARGFAMVLSNPWLWAPPLVAGYLLAWALPGLASRLSRLLYWEHWAPRTRVGKGCLTISLAVGGSAGALGASVGMFSSRFDEVSVAIWAVALLSSLGSIDVAFVNAWELWPQRPWAGKAEELPSPTRAG